MAENLNATTTGAHYRNQRSSLAVNLGLLANIVLAILKISVGILGHSPALLADGVNSTSDVAYYLVVSVFIRLARKPADTEHPFGHSQFESIAALTVGSFVITTAIAIFWDAVNNAYDQITGVIVSDGAEEIALWVALFTIILKLGLYEITRRLAAQSENPAVLALAYDHRNDIFSAGAAFTGILLGRIGYGWLDPLAGALVALVVLRTGVSILRESASELMDTVPGAELEKQVHQVLKGISGVQDVESIHAHRFGPYLTMNITIGVDGELSVAEGDWIASQAEQHLLRSIDFLRVAHIHYHPTSKNGAETYPEISRKG